MKTPQSKVRKVKAWAVVSLRGLLQETSTRRCTWEVEKGIQQQDAATVFPRKTHAIRWWKKWKNSDSFTLVPVTITYTLPKPSKKKTK